MSKNPQAYDAQSDYAETSKKQQPYSNDYDERRSYGSGRNQNFRDYEQENRQRNQGGRQDYDRNQSEDYRSNSSDGFNRYENRTPPNYGGSNQRYGQGSNESYGSRDWDEDNARYDRSQNSERGPSSYGYENSGRRNFGNSQRSGQSYSYGDRADQDYGRSGGRYQERSRQWNERSSEEEDGQFRGKGPKGYKRSDERIQDDVNDTLTDNGMIDASDIEVSVENGDVTLSGTVRSKRDKRLSEDLAESVSGVSNVENKLRVKKDTQDSEEEYNAKDSMGEQRKKRQSNQTLN